MHLIKIEHLFGILQCISYKITKISEGLSILRKKTFIGISLAFELEEPIKQIHFIFLF